MKILVASTLATGHLNPLLAITRVLLGEGHEIAFLTGSAFRDRIESSGAKFISLPAGADFDLRQSHRVVISKIRGALPIRRRRDWRA